MLDLMTRRVNSHSRANGARGMQSRDPLTMDQIRNVVPSVFAEQKHNSRSERYTYIPTAQIVEHLMSRDFGVFAVSQGGSRDEENRGFTKHMIRFRQLSQGVQVGGTHNEIVLLNSHDGTSAYRLMAGVFRLVCSNGMIVAQSMIEDIRIKHSGRILEDVSAGVVRLADQLPLVSQSVESMREISLIPQEQEIFARAALTVKYGEDAPIETTQALTVRRSEDRDPTLWNTLNRVQESLIRGGDRYRRETDRGVQRRRTQPVNSVDGQTTVNRALWQLAEEMKRLKTA